MEGRRMERSGDQDALRASAPPARDQRVAAILRDRFRGCLLWGAVGDALGRPVEGWDPARIAERFGEGGLRDYIPWRGWREGPTGTITDDTQLTIEVARSLLATGGRFQPADFVSRLIRWLPIGRGKGKATVSAVLALEEGTPWWRIGQVVDSAGNGAAMRAAPIGLARALEPSRASLIHDATRSALPTHTHPVGVAGAVAIAAGVAWCIQRAPESLASFDTLGFVQAVTDAIAGLEPEPTEERRPGGKAVYLRERIAELPRLLDEPDLRKVLRYTYNVMVPSRLNRFRPRCTASCAHPTIRARSS